MWNWRMNKMPNKYIRPNKDISVFWTLLVSSSHADIVQLHVGERNVGSNHYLCEFERLIWKTYSQWKLIFVWYDGTTYLLYTMMSMWFKYIQCLGRYRPKCHARPADVLSHYESIAAVATKNTASPHSNHC